MNGQRTHIANALVGHWQVGEWTDLSSTSPGQTRFGPSCCSCKVTATRVMLFFIGTCPDGHINMSRYQPFLPVSSITCVTHAAVTEIV